MKVTATSAREDQWAMWSICTNPLPSFFSPPRLKIIFCFWITNLFSSLSKLIASSNFEKEINNRIEFFLLEFFLMKKAEKDRKMYLWIFLQLQLWDTGGLERVASITTSYFKNADAVLLVFGYDALESFNMLSHHLLEVLTHAESAKIFLCGNKMDIRAKDGSGPTEADEEAFCREYQVSDRENFIQKTYRISCKTRQGVHEMFEDVASTMLRVCRTEDPLNLEHIRLQSQLAAAAAAPKKKCCN